MQLNRSTLYQASTLADLHFQQVLDNVARFAVNPYTMPYFAYAGSGTTQVADGGTISPTISWAPHSVSEMLGLSANRTITDGWSVVPTTNPDKLFAMRCCYQRLVLAPTDWCDDCENKLAAMLPKDFPSILDATFRPAGSASEGKSRFQTGPATSVIAAKPMPGCRREGWTGSNAITLTILNIATLAPPSAATSQQRQWLRPRQGPQEQCRGHAKRRSCSRGRYSSLSRPIESLVLFDFVPPHRGNRPRGDYKGGIEPRRPRSWWHQQRRFSARTDADAASA